MADTEPASDDELIARVARGDREAFAALYRRHRSDVYRFAVHLSGRAVLAEDVMQDVFVAVIEDAGRYQPGRSGVRPWLLGIARNHVKRWQSQRPSIPLPTGENQRAAALAVETDPLGELTRERRLSALRCAVLELPLKYREVVVLCDLQELSYADAATALGCVIGTVRSRLHRGRALLAKRLSEPPATAVCRVPATRLIL